MLSQSLAPLAEWRQWILWKLTERDGKAVKLPVSPHTGQLCNAHDTANHVTHAEALAAAGRYGAGVGFVFTESDPFFFLDIDHCLTASGWSQGALEIVAALPGAAVEISQSGEGLHVFGRGGANLPHGCRNSAMGLELYTSGRFVALTDRDTVGNVNTDCSAALAADRKSVV